jgi:glycogen operon protein
VNFITCHDGFTLNDLVSYSRKHNEANQEHNNDGSNDNNSWNWGVEGDSDEPNIVRQRKQLVKNAFCLLFFSMGTPMMLGGDEFMRTQHGNNNAYCQDNDISWFDWNAVRENEDVVQFVRKTIAFTKRYTVLQNRMFFQGRDLNDDSVPDISWFGADLGHPRWHDADARLLCYRLDGGEIESDLGPYHLFIILNSSPDMHRVAIPTQEQGKRWYRVIDTSLASGGDFLESGQEIALDPADFYLVNPRSVVTLVGK